jgi:hypothetical protein
MGYEPPRCLGEANGLKDKEDGKDSLKSERESPLEARFVRAGSVAGPLFTGQIIVSGNDKRYLTSKQ